MSRILDFQLTLGLCLLYVVAVFCTSNSFDSCYRGDQDCPPCPDTSHNLNFTSILFLSIFPQMINAAKQAQLLINQTDSQNVISLERLFGLHTSLNYFCCHSQSEKETIVQVLRKFQWTPKILTYDVFGCNLDHDGVTIYLHAQPNSVGQRTLFTMIREIEQAIENAGKFSFCCQSHSQTIWLSPKTNSNKWNFLSVVTTQPKYHKLNIIAI